MYYIYVKAKEEDPQQSEVQHPPVATPLRKRCASRESLETPVAANTLPEAKKIKQTTQSPTLVPVATAPSQTQQPQQSGEGGDGTFDGNAGEKPPNNPKPKFIPGGLTRRQAWGF